jgi:hypothetical protein
LIKPSATARDPMNVRGSERICISRFSCDDCATTGKLARVP